MNFWIEHRVAMAHYNDLLRTAEMERLARWALAGRPKSQNAWCKVLSWLGSRLSSWGKYLQERYGSAATPIPCLPGPSD